MSGVNLTAYINSLPGVLTERLPQGSLFVADDLLYQVIETRSGGYHKARRWGGDEHSEVALVSGSSLSHVLPLIEKGHLLPVYSNRRDLTSNHESIVYVFPTEKLALECAELDVAMVRGGGVYVRKHVNDPSYEVTDGAHVFRMYYFARTLHGRGTQFLVTLRQSQAMPILCTNGPAHWKLLPQWQQSALMPISAEETQNGMMPVVLDHPSDDTQPHKNML